MRNSTTDVNIAEIKSYLEMLFCVCDLDGNSKLTFDEVNSEMCLFDSPPSEEEFYKADADSDRAVTLEEALAISNSNSITFRRQLSYNGISGLKEGLYLYLTILPNNFIDLSNLNFSPD